MSTNYVMLLGKIMHWKIFFNKFFTTLKSLSVGFVLLYIVFYSNSKLATSVKEIIMLH